MRDASRLTVDVSDIQDRPGASKQASLTWTPEDLSTALARVVPDPPVHLDLRLDALVDGIHVSGPIRATVLTGCRRCLEDVEREVSVEVGEVFVAPGEGADDDAYAIEDDALDLTPMVRDAVMLALPLHPLCRDDCRGLCAVCGANRNDEDCGHSADRIDVRWEPLSRLRDQPEG